MSEGYYREHSRYEFDSDVGDPEAQTEESEFVDLPGEEAFSQQEAQYISSGSQKSQSDQRGEVQP